MSHTAGPWAGFLSERDGHAAWLIGPSSARPILAEVSADEEYGLTGATVEANARLIAAAPELLEVAFAARAVHREDCAKPDCSLTVALSRVIAKAEGREP